MIIIYVISCILLFVHTEALFFSCIRKNWHHNNKDCSFPWSQPQPLIAWTGMKPCY